MPLTQEDFSVRVCDTVAQETAACQGLDISDVCGASAELLSKIK